MENVIDFGVDYLTLTTNRLFEHNGQEGTRLRKLLDDRWFVGQVGVELQTWAWNGYNGWRYGSLNAGVRPDGGIVRVSGGAARILADAIDWEGWKCTRLDIQATFRMKDKEVDEYIEEQSKRVLEERVSKRGRPYNVTHLKSYGQGDTLYVGSRSSELYVRLYNKGAESDIEPMYEMCGRIEMELKSTTAQRVFQELQQAENQALLALYRLAATTSEKGFSTLRGKIDPNITPIRVMARETDTDRQLAWLETHVSPTVGRLIAQGRDYEVYEALGLRGLLLAVDGHGRHVVK